MNSPTRPQTPVAIALGSNVGDREGHLRNAMTFIGGLPDVTVERVSAFIETEPVGDLCEAERGGKYLNGAAVIQTTREPVDLLRCLLNIEARLGRVRCTGKAGLPRTVDLDILLYGEESLNLPDLSIPHPRMHSRFFALAPLCEIAPDWIVPGRSATVRDLLDLLMRDA